MEERLNALLRLAILHEASDIHFTNFKAETKVEMRIADTIKLVKGHPDDRKMIRYLQYKANLDVGNLTKPQTGQFEWYLDDRFLSLRFALIHNPTMENAVLRILNEDLGLKAESLAIADEQNRFFKRMMQQRHGLFIASGPTSSGKTTSLYTLLHGIRHKKIITIEDPIEIHSEDFIQIAVNEKAGLGYDEAIKQVLRHDPDIIMIGEIRDELTAHMAIRAANTGHLVITSLHAGSSILAIERLLELKVEKGALKNVLIGISNQRLFQRKGTEKKIVIYETMERDDILYYFAKGRVKDDFYRLKDRIKEAQRQGLIDEDLALQELIIT